MSTEPQPTAVLDFDPNSGKLVQMSPEEAVVEPVVTRPGGPKLQRVRFPDDPQGPSTFQTTINLDGLQVNVDLFDESQYAAFQAEEKRINGMMRELATGGEGAVDAVYQAQLAHCDAILVRHLKGFDGHAVPEGRKTNLFFSDKIRFVDLLAMKSRLGRTDTDFLPLASST